MIIGQVSFRSHLRVNDAKGLPSAALTGFGVVRINQGLAHDALSSGRLVRALPDHQTVAGLESSSPYSAFSDRAFSTVGNFDHFHSTPPSCLLTGSGERSVRPRGESSNL